MIGHPPGIFYSQMIVRAQMFIDFVDLEIFAKQSGVPNNFYINIIYKNLIPANHFGTKNSEG